MMLGKLNAASARLLSNAGQGANERCDLAPAGNRPGGVAAMLEGVPVIFPSTRAPGRAVAELTYENRHDETSPRRRGSITSSTSIPRH
jgi:hypothetical protein